MAKRTTYVSPAVRARYPATLPDGWQSMTGPELAAVLPLGTVAAILDGRLRDALRAKDAAETRLRLEVLRREIKEYRQQMSNMDRRARAKGNPALKEAAERFRAGAQWKELAGDYDMSPDGLRQAVRDAGHSTARAKERTPPRPLRRT